MFCVRKRVLVLRKGIEAPLEHNVVNVLSILDETGKAVQRAHITATKAQLPATRAHINKCLFCHAQRPLQIVHMSASKTEPTRWRSFFLALTKRFSDKPAFTGMYLQDAIFPPGFEPRPRDYNSHQPRSQPRDNFQGPESNQIRTRPT